MLKQRGLLSMHNTSDLETNDHVHRGFACDTNAVMMAAMLKGKEVLGLSAGFFAGG